MYKANKKIWLNYILAPICLLVLLFLIYRQLSNRTSLQEEWLLIQQQWKSGHNGWLIIVCLLAPLNWGLEALKWHRLLKKIEPCSYPKAYAAILTGTAFSIVTPNKIGDFAGRMLYVENKHKLSSVIATLVSNLAQTIMIYSFGLIGLIYFLTINPSAWAYWTLAAAILAIVVLGLLFFKLDQLADWLSKFSFLRKIKVVLRIVKRYQKKDLRFLLLASGCRFLIYNIQFVLLLYFWGNHLDVPSALLLSAFMFWLIAVIPSIFVTDVGIRVFIAQIIFVDTALITNSTPLISISIIWILNLIVPAIIGSLLILGVRIVR